MDTRIIDLHVHSKASDGTFTPTELVEEAKRAGLAAFALTDHDTTDGVAEAMTAAKAAGIELIPGVELSTEYEGTEVHVLGLYIDVNNAGLQKQMADFRDSRDNRNIYMLEKLRTEGFDITQEALEEKFPNAVITRAHIARYLLDQGYIPDMKTAFSEYIGDGCRCYVGRPKVTPMDAVDYILAAGGIPVLAHPVIYHMERPQLIRMIREMKEHGLVGMEAIYSENTPADEQELKALARAEGLLITGGSDFHGTNKPDIRLGVGRGKLYIPYSILEKIKAEIQ
ncbi:MAG: PHP domain-containing protein [Lachnospiraceae bacterium]|nr:PHP domain-containing protein [Lachnospiraceae bacterium]MDD7177446.1 PHP domain-containing protein [bacterium]MDY5516448.1 PHP domain-containing protein [Lachnospiraceae bacterium]